MFVIDGDQKVIDQSGEMEMDQENESTDNSQTDGNRKNDKKWDRKF